MFDIVTKSFQYGQNQVVMETGRIARQADGAVLVNVDDTVVLATVVGKREAKPGQDFFPLTVDYVEKTYAAGRIPGGFFKREGRPSEKETLTSRLIDRPLRPLFPEGFFNEVQIVVTVLSVNPDVDPDIPALIAASAALAISGIPFSGPIGAARVGYIDGQYVLNPAISKMSDTKMDLIVAGTDDAVLMVESEAQQLSEEIMLGAVVFGHEQQRTVIQAINELVESAGKPEWNWSAEPKALDLIERVRALAEVPLQEAYSVREKQLRVQHIDEVSAHVLAQLVTGEEGAPDKQAVRNILFDLEAGIVRGRILSGQPRIDGRDTRSVRPIEIQVGVLPRTHGSALFTRGETQALAVATLGTDGDSQLIDGLLGEGRDRFMLHYNMPPYATGETGRVGSPKRREIGHGRLARRALQAVLPSQADFAYTIRLVSEITESNGSSSMASVCGGCLSLMDAGVPITDHVAGIAMGLIKEGNRFAVLTDILGDEDHLGDMDFKVAGTEQGITALQMDIKITGITQDIMQIALMQAREGRLHILSLMRQSMGGARDDVSLYAPRMVTMKINPDKIREVIGKGGATIKALTEETQTSIDIQDDGTIVIAAANVEKAEEAKRRIEALVVVPEVGQVYEGKVARLLDFGAIVEIMPGKDGLLHISQISDKRINAVGDVLKEGQIVQVKLIEMDEKGRMRLSMRALLAESNADEAEVSVS